MIGTSTEHRSVLTEALLPPAGYALDSGVICTYSLSLPTLLTLPAHILLGDDTTRERLMGNPIALLDALRQARDKLTVFVHAGGMHAPRRHHILYGLLEPMVKEVHLPIRHPRRGIPATGAFHPKVWALRFTSKDGTKPDRMRLLILSRNLTEDRSWDLSLRLDGEIRGKRNKRNAPLRKLLRALAVNQDQATASRAESIAESLSRTGWTLPPGFDTIDFVVLGLKGSGWLPRFEGVRSQSLLVVSPFLGATALGRLTATADTSMLVSMPAELQRQGAALDAFASVHALTEDAETEDGEEVADRDQLHGLHAKLYVYKKGWRVRVAIGSANATPRALDGGNVEVMAVLEGSAARVGRPEEFLHAEKGIGDLLTPWDATQTADVEQPDGSAGLDALRARLASADLHLRYDAETKTLALHTDGPIDLSEADDVVCWPTTVASDHGVDAKPLGADAPVSMLVESHALVTGLLAFQLNHADAPAPVRFVLNLAVDGMPDERMASIMQSILKNPEGFLRYLRYLLGELAAEDVFSDDGEGTESQWSRLLGLGDSALLEAMMRALSRQPERLEPVRDLVQHLSDTDQGREMLPHEFMLVWQALAPHLAEKP